MYSYIMASQPISMAYFTNPSHLSVSVYVSLLSLLGKGLVKCIPLFVVGKRLVNMYVHAAQNTCNNRRTVRRVCLWVCVCIPLSLLRNNSLKTFPRQRRIVGGVIFYAVRVVSKESRRSVLPRSSCFTGYNTDVELQTASTARLDLMAFKKIRFVRQS
jgi:hypothetical protein